MNNRKHNATNPNQGAYKKALCVCSAGLLRSPSLAFHLSNNGFNTRACGANSDFALVCMDEVLIEWADVIIFVNEENNLHARNYFDYDHKKVVVLDIPDRYQFRDPKLMEIINKQCIEQGIHD